MAFNYDSEVFSFAGNLFEECDDVTKAISVDFVLERFL